MSFSASGAKRTRRDVLAAERYSASLQKNKGVADNQPGRQRGERERHLWYLSQKLQTKFKSFINSTLSGCILNGHASNFKFFFEQDLIMKSIIWQWRKKNHLSQARVAGQMPGDELSVILARRLAEK